MLRRPRGSTLFPYTTLFRSHFLAEPAKRVIQLARLIGGHVGILIAANRQQRRLHAIEAEDRRVRSEEHTSELQSQSNLVCRLLLEKKNTQRCRRCSALPPLR